MSQASLPTYAWFTIGVLVFVALPIQRSGRHWSASHHRVTTFSHHGACLDRQHGELNITFVNPPQNADFTKFPCAKAPTKPANFDFVESGSCHENSTKPSPRTEISSYTREQYSAWWVTHKLNADDAASFYCHYSSAKILFIGDSITESYRGTSYGTPRASWSDIPNTLHDMLAENDVCAKKHVTSLPLAISGDQTQHLLFRLQNGEIPLGLRAAPHTTVSLMIGTNNIAVGYPADEIVNGIMAVAQWLVNNTQVHVVVNALLPRGPSTTDPLRLVVAKVNALLQKRITVMVDRDDYNFASRVSFVDCGHTLLEMNHTNNIDNTATTNNNNDNNNNNNNSNYNNNNNNNNTNNNNRDGSFDVTVMPDGLHPSAKGHRKYLTCLLPVLCTTIP